ncbi:hypothetical protein [Streptomyces sp. NPDC052012]|uniref:hypothetical protein n=1 Tax=Streptomyces sp. NPDC052012 TaxID=3155051 RepID=UPI00344FB689
MAPPPPRASARFPDSPPTVGRGIRTGALPSQPNHRPGADRADAPVQTPSETTARLRPIPAERSPEPSEGPRTSEDTRRTPDPAGTLPVPPPDTSRADTSAGSAGWGSPGDQVSPDRPHAPGPVRRPSVPPPATPRSGVSGSGTAAFAAAPPAAGPDATSRAAGAYSLPDPALSWNAAPAPGSTAYGEAERHQRQAWPRVTVPRGRGQAVAAAVCLVLGAGLIGGAVTGSWLAGDSGEPGQRRGFAAGRSLWHSVPVDQLFPPTVQGSGAGPGDADRTWTRIAVAPDSGCKGAFDPLLRKVLAPVGCERLLRATYTDATQSHVTTVGLLFTKADPAGMTSLARRFDRERLDRRTDLMPLPYAAKDTAAESFGKRQRAAWAISVLTDAPVVVYAVSGWADGRSVDTPQPAADALESGATTAPAQSGLGHEAQGLADRVERGLRKTVGTADRERAS